MKFDFTLDKLAACIPQNRDPEPWFLSLQEYLPQFEIVTVQRVAGFISQCAHESNDFTVLVENLNYGAEGLCSIFGKYFRTDAEAFQFQRRPAAIANRVYANRMSNGPESSGDGWAYRGRGILQITGRYNYSQCSMDVFQDTSLVDNPDLLTTPAYAVVSACWYWNKNSLNAICDSENVTLLSKKINGGTNGLNDRISRWNHCINILS